MRVAVLPKKMSYLDALSSKTQSFHLISSYPHITSGSAETGYGTPTNYDGWRGRKRAGGKEVRTHVEGEG